MQRQRVRLGLVSCLTDFKLVMKQRHTDYHQILYSVTCLSMPRLTMLSSFMRILMKEEEEKEKK